MVQVGLPDVKPCGVLNVGGFYDPLLALSTWPSDCFVQTEHCDLVLADTNVYGCSTAGIVQTDQNP